jgi:hypothetical protein
VRPSLAIIDDPQTDDSARSLAQCTERYKVLNGAVNGLAGPGKRVAQIMPCTVIRAGDVADQILDREKNPHWFGERTKMVNKWPNKAGMRLWDEYASIRSKEAIEGGDGSRATAFYAANRDAMDKGAEVAWPARYNKDDELSALQHAFNIKLRDEPAFFAEYQNDPIQDEHEDDGLLTSDQIAAKVNGLGRGVLPLSVSHLTMFIDVQKKALFYVVCAWADDFTGHVIDYGTYPEQRQGYFTLAQMQITLAHKAPKAGMEGQIFAGLEALSELKLGQDYRRDDGAHLRVTQCLVDANWGESTDVVYQFCRQSKYAGLIIPSHGRFVGASGKPMGEYRPEAGCRTGLNWRIPLTMGRRAVRHALYDTNFWKSFIHARLAVAQGDKGCLSLYGNDPNRHQLYADHMTSEYRIRTVGRGRTVDEWKLKPNQDNHWFDCTVGAAVAASMLGAKLHIGEMKQEPRRGRKRFSADDIRKAYNRKGA